MLLVAGVAAAYWITTGGGSATAATASTSALTLAPATPTAQLYPGGQATVVLTVTNPGDVAFAAAELKPYDHVVRGGTDGSRLTELGLPTPNLFCGEHNAHGPLEWVAVQDMESAVTACAHLAELWERKG